MSFGGSCGAYQGYPNMAVDTATKAAAKWAELSKAESGTIDKVLKGTATKADTDRLLKLINQYSKLAGDVFKRGVDIIETTADKRIAAEVKKRSRGGKELTDAETEQLVKDVTAAVYQERSADLLQAIEELVDSANDSLAQFSEEQYTEAVDTAKSQYDELIRRLKGQVKEKATPKEKPAVGKTVEDVLREVEEGQGPYEDGGASLDEILSSPDSPKGKAAEAARRQEVREDTENWATQWWRKFNEYKDDFGGKAKDVGKNILTELAKLGGLAYIFSPVFRKWIDDKLAEIGNFFTIDNAQKLLGQAWDFIKKEADEFTNYLKDLFGFKDVDPVRQEADRREAQEKAEKEADQFNAKAEELKKQADAIRESDKGTAVWRAVTTNQMDVEAARAGKQGERAARRAQKIEAARRQAAADEATLSGGGGGGYTSASTPPASASTTIASTPAMKGQNEMSAAEIKQPEIILAASRDKLNDRVGVGNTIANAELKRVLPPAGGGEGYVPNSGSSLLPLSNMIR